METIKFDIKKTYGKFKILNATNGGPVYKRHASDQWRTNFSEYKAARIPYSRNHDSNAIPLYGGPYAHDISAIFPDFSADENAPENYDFACTDESILCTLEAGTKTFFRLGQTIEHQIKKHHTLPPKDFEKWARICEHIIRHYTEGWANGFTHDMPYWEIWNEPDLDDGNSTNKRNWGGTKEEFFRLYEVAAKHLKSCFPHLKIGGPALAWREDWANDFLCEMQKRKVTIDFFSWHIYAAMPEEVSKKANTIRAMLDKYGYTRAESILDEWNYVRGWTEDFVYTLEMIHGIKGAAYVAAVLSLAQQSPIDMLMYYDTRPSTFNGIFDFYTCLPLKGYYPLKWYGEFYDCVAEVRAETLPKNIYALCGVDKSGKITAMITHYAENEETEKNVGIKIDFGRESRFDIYLLDGEHNGELLETNVDLTFEMPVHTCIMIKEK